MVDPSKSAIITSDNPCDILFLQKILKFEADIIIAHRDWKISEDTIYNVSNVCYVQEYDPDGKIAFNNIIRSFPVRFGLFWDKDMLFKLYRRYYQNYYDDYFNKLSKAKQQDPPKAIFYNAFSKTVNEYINLEKKHGNIVLKPGR